MKKIVFFIAVLTAQVLQAQVAVSYVTADQAVQALLGPGVNYANPVFTGLSQQLGQMTGNTDHNFQITEGIVLGCSDAQEIVPDFFGTFINPNNTGIYILPGGSGAGYTSGANIPVSGGSGTGMTVTITATAGAVTFFTVNNFGTGYLNGDILTINQVNSGLNAQLFLNDIDLLYVANSVPSLIGQVNPAGVPNFVVGSVNNIASLEFDFVATGNVLNFNYIFGSDEYLTYVNSQYNDVFAFFLSGPGITGPYSSPSAFPGGAVNIAIVPQSTPPLPITISSVNNVLNSLYYVNNPTDQITFDHLIPVGLNGFTKKIAAQYDLQCGETYHIRLAIANGSDTSLKSDVIIEAGSFNTGASLIESVAVANAGISPIPGFPANSILEGDGCYNGQFVITPPPCLTESDTIQLLFTGTATIDQDYNTNGVTQIILVPGVSDTLFVNGMIDNVVEGSQTVTFGNITAGYETIEIGFVFFNPTTQLPDTATAFLNIVDYVPTELAPVTDILNLCPNATVPVDAVTLISNGVPNYTFNWQDGAGSTIGTNAVQSFAVGSAGNYELTVTDYCGNADSSLFIVTEPPAIAFAVSQDLCTGYDSEILVTGGLQPYIFTPAIPSAFVVNSITNTAFGNIGGSYDLTVTDACNQTGVVPFLLTVCDTQEPNLLLINADEYDNEHFIIKGLESFPNSQLRLYNRWGTVIYESLNYSNLTPWDATDAEDGVYFWIFNRSDGEIREGYVHVMHKKP